MKLPLYERRRLKENHVKRKCSVVVILSLCCLLCLPLYLPFFVLTNTNNSSKPRPWTAPVGQPVGGDWSNLTGTFQYSDTDACRTHDCIIQFPYALDKRRLPRNACNAGSCILTRKGDKDRMMGRSLPNQDRLLLMSPLSLESSSNNDLLILLADGHGERGHQSAEIVLLDLPFRILQNFLKMTPAPDLFKQTFLQTDQGTIQHVVNSGTTTIAVLVHDGKVYLASAGDSTAFVARWNGREATILAQAVKHKPAHPKERARIEANGGQVWLPPDEQGTSSRVIIRDERGNLEMALAMSRSLGDPDGKRLKVLTAEPDVVTVDLKQQEPNHHKFFVVVASDGVTDFLQLPQIANSLGKSLFGGGPSLATTCETIFQQAANKWRTMSQGSYRDDMSLAVSQIQL